MRCVCELLVCVVVVRGGCELHICIFAVFFAVCY